MMRLAWIRCSMVLIAVCAAHAQSSPVPGPQMSITSKSIPAESWPAVAAAFQASLITGMRNGKTFLEVRISQDANGRTMEWLGFADRDIVHSIDGIAVYSYEMAVKLLREAKPGSEVRIVSLRGNKKRVLVLDRDRQATDQRSDMPRTNSAQPRGDLSVAETDGVMVLNEAALEREWADVDPIMLVLQSGLAFVRNANGNVVGVTSSRLGEIPISSKLGLKNNDIILSVNGLPIHSEQAIFEIAEKLEGQRNFAVRIRRDGKEVTLRYRVE